ncbi:MULTISPECIES: two-partner secretion domain-containing protein [Roseomonadaceae]|uniref:Filamentous hemagglutinin N-terminal domain-containing protein n=1 Tax=Falsiroseomonas oleicola TaxID=2801474 RepID=A0ABS6H8E2_9PROT|nr:filamentous hemagglutinin N-terminal domain-containing protein [Roseomonas oleicola]MBU8544641.1 filamentous hemagglutinin N-terminal domain-containing protein [Roseomonas oleicola]
MPMNLRLAARRHLLASTALLPVMAAGPVFAQAPNAAPTGGQVVAGSAAISQSATTTTINQASNRAAIDWRGFDVGRNQAVQFNQPNAGSWTLNRVTGPDPSLIAGRITANGGVAIVNQSGIVFTPGAQVNVGSLIASASNITNENFMAGRMVFDGPARPGARVENHGSITVADRGLASLVAPGVANSGLIRARLGRVALAGAETFTLDLAGDGLVALDVTQSVRQGPGGGVALVTNSGVVEAAGGSVLLTADAARGVVDTLVRNTGRISVDAASGAAAGQVAITGSGGDVRLEGGRVSATGTAPGVRGGRVAVAARDGAVVVGAAATVDASGAGGGGSVQLGGAATRRVEVAGQVAARGNGASVRGGLVAAQAKQDVDVAGGAKLDASGTGGGGTVLAGTTGFGRGQQMAETTRIAAGATLAADATEAGTGGTVAVNSTTRTEMRGAISARGGAAGGDGGFVEISGQAALSIAGTVDVRAPAGRDGTLFIDPDDISIVAGADDSGLDGVAGIVVAAEAGLGEPAVITNGTIAAFAGTVRLEAADTITVDAAIAKANGGLTLVAGTTITLNADVALTGAGSAFTATSGTIAGAGGVQVADGATIMLRSDALTLAGALDAGATGLVEIGPRTAGAAFTAALPAGGVTAGRLRLGETRSGDIVDWGQDALAQGTRTAGAVTVAADLAVAGISLELIGASIAVDAAVTAADITLRADAGDITQAVGGRLTADSLSAVASAGSVLLATADPRNAVGAVTGSASENFRFGSSQAVTVGPVTAGDDLSIIGTAVTVTGALDAGAQLSLEATAGAVALQAAVSGDVGIDLSATADITQTLAGLLTTPTLSATSSTGSVLLATADPRNAVGAVSGSASDNFRFGGSQAVTVGPITAGDDLSIIGTAVTVTGALQAGAQLSLQGTAGAVALQAAARGDVGIDLSATADITQTLAGLLTTPALSATSSAGSVRLATADPRNAVDALSGSADGDFLFSGANDLLLGPLTAGGDVTIGGPTITVDSAVTAGAVLTLTADTALVVNGPLAGTGQAGVEPGVALTANSISLTQQVVSGAGTDITLVTDLLTATGGALLQAGTLVDGGTLSIAPRTAARDIRLGGGALADTLVIGDDVIGVIAAATERLLIDGGTTSAVTGVGADLAARDVEQVELRGLSIALTGGLSADTGITFLAQNNVTQTADGLLTVPTLSATSTAGSVLLATANPINAVDTVGGAANGDFLFRSSNALTVGAVTAGAAASITAPSVTVTGAVQAGTLATLAAGTAGIALQAGVSGTTGITLVAVDDITQTLAGRLTTPTLSATSSAGAVLLATADPRNAVDAVGGAAAGNFLFDSANNLAAGPITAGGAVTLTAPSITVTDAVQAGTTATLTAGTGGITLEDSLTAVTAITLVAVDDITQTAAGLLTAPTLSATSSAGSVLLATADPRNAVDAVSGAADEDFRFSGANDLALGAVTAGQDIAITGPRIDLGGVVQSGAGRDITLVTDAFGPVGGGASLQAGTVGDGGTLGISPLTAGRAIQLGGAAALDPLVVGADVIGVIDAAQRLFIDGSTTSAVTVDAAGADLAGRGVAQVELRGLSLALEGGLTAGTGITLLAQNNVTQTADGLLTVPTLSATSTAGSVLLATASPANAVDTVGGAAAVDFLFSSSNPLTVNAVTAGAAAGITAPSITVTGAVQAGTVATLTAGTAGIDLQAGVSGTTGITLVAVDDITQTAAGLLTTPTLSATSSAGAIALAEANVVAHVTAVADEGVSFRSTQALTVDGVTAGADSVLRGDVSLALAGAVDVAVNRLDLRSNGVVGQQVTGLITAGTLDVFGASGAASGAITLDQANAVGSFGATTSAGVNFRSTQALTVDGVIAAADSTLRGDVALALGGAVGVGANRLDLRSDGTASQQATGLVTAGTLDVRGASGGASGAITLDQANTVGSFGAASSAGVNFRSTQALTVDGVAAGADSTLRGDVALALGGAVGVGANRLDLRSDGTASQQAVGVVTAGTLDVRGASGGASGAVTLAEANAVGSFGAASSAGVNFRSTQALTVDGVAAGADSTLRGDAALALGGAVGVGANRLDLRSDGAASQQATGLVTAGTLDVRGASGAAAASVTLDQANEVANITGAASGGVTFRSARLAGLTATDVEAGAALALAADTSLTASGTLRSTGGDVALVGQTGVTQTAGSISGSGAVALTSAAGGVTTTTTVQGDAVALSGQSGVTQTAGSIIGSGAVTLTAAGGAVDAAGTVQSTASGVALSGQAGVTQTAGSIIGSGAVTLTAAGGAVDAAGTVQSTSAGVTLSGLSGRLGSESTVRGAGPVQVTASVGGVAANGTLVSDSGGVQVQAQGDITQASGLIAGANVQLESATRILATGGRIEAGQLTAVAPVIEIGRFSSDPLNPTHGAIVRELTEVRAITGAAVIRLQGLSDGTETVVTGAQSGIDGYDLQSTGSLLLRNATVQAQTGDATILADGFLRLDPGSSVAAPGRVRLAAGQSPEMAQALLLDGATLQGRLVELVVGAAGSSGGELVANGSTIRAGTAVLFAAGGNMVTGDVTVTPLDSGRLPLVIYDSRRTASALRAIPGTVADDTTDRPGLPGNEQVWQVLTSEVARNRAAFRVFGADDGPSGAATAAAAGTLTLALDAGESPVFLLLDGGTATGVLRAGRLGVHGLVGEARAEGDNVVALSGTLSGISLGIAAQFGRTTAALPNDQVRYRINECVIGSVNCVAPSLAQPFAVPIENRIDIRSDRPRLDPDVLLPNIAEEDY